MEMEMEGRVRGREDMVWCDMGWDLSRIKYLMVWYIHGIC